MKSKDAYNSLAEYIAVALKPNVLMLPKHIDTIINLSRAADQFKGENEAIAEVDYWKKRCEAAEDILLISGIETTVYHSDSKIKPLMDKWQSLKSK